MKKAVLGYRNSYRVEAIFFFFFCWIYIFNLTMITMDVPLLTFPFLRTLISRDPSERRRSIFDKMESSWGTRDDHEKKKLNTNITEEKKIVSAEIKLLRIRDRNLLCFSVEFTVTGIQLIFLRRGDISIMITRWMVERVTFVVEFILWIQQK